MSTKSEHSNLKAIDELESSKNHLKSYAILCVYVRKGIFLDEEERGGCCIHQIPKEAHDKGLQRAFKINSNNNLLNTYS